MIKNAKQTTDKTLTARTGVDRYQRVRQMTFIR